MAKPIPLHRTPAQTATEQSVLELLRDLNAAGPEIIARLSEAANTPQGIAIIRNLLATLEFLRSVDPAILRALARIVGKTRQVGAMIHGVRVFGQVLLSKQR